MTVNLYKDPKSYSFSKYLDFIARNTAIVCDRLDTLGPIQAYLASLHSLESQRFINEEKERNSKKAKLWLFGYKVYSQHEEDGMIAEIFKRIGITTGFFVEIGVQSGIECNTVKLLVEGWGGLWIEGSTEDVRKASKIQHQFDKLVIKEEFATAENINTLLQPYSSEEIDLLSIDIDYNDYWIWKALTVAKPRVVIIEYNALWPPPNSFVTPYDPEVAWDGTNYYGASLEAMTKLATSKGYSLIGCNFAGTNAFYIRNDLINAFKEFQPFSAEKHYEPVRFTVRPTLGHQTRIGPYKRT